MGQEERERDVERLGWRKKVAWKSMEEALRVKKVWNPEEVEDGVSSFLLVSLRPTPLSSLGALALWRRIGTPEGRSWE